MNASLPAVSVILPVYNGGRFLRDAVESVLRQTHPQLELIVVDGGSTDDTRKIAESFGCRLRYFFTGRDNVSIAKNFGIARAAHPWISFMSGDDVWEPEKLGKQAGLLMANPAISICVCRLRYFLERGCDWPGNFPKKLRDGEHTGYICETLFLRREVFAQVGLFDETLATAEDVDWFARARKAGFAIGEVPAVLLHKRVHDRNISLTGAGAQSDLMRALRGNILRKGGAP
jgi:glycosyltransferase involved in cell wall biosynthesis